MITKAIKQISIREYLNRKSIHPVKNYGYYGMYYCPYREDRNASFKIDYNKNIWYDFGTNEGGSIIDLVMKMENLSLREAINRLEKYIQSNDQLCQKSTITTNERSHVRRSQQTKCQENTPSITIQNMIPISHPGLISWVRERNIDLNLANLYCREIHYQNQGKDYFSVGFRNDKGGYELSSPPNFKGCIAPKEITTISNNQSNCLVFEGIWDFLSYLSLQKIEKTQHDVVILNSVANIQKAMDFLKLHKEIYTYLDNDEAGRKTTELIKSVCISVNNRSNQYTGYKDLNDYLCGKKQTMDLPIKKKNSGLKI